MLLTVPTAAVDLPPSCSVEELELWQLLEHEARRLGLAGDELLAFVESMTPGYMRPTHLQPVVDMLEAAKRGERIRACVSVPPRHGKTETIVHGVAKWIAERPAELLGYLSYNDHVAGDKSRRIREITRRCGVPFSDDQNAVGLWHPCASAATVDTCLR